MTFRDRLLATIAAARPVLLERRLRELRSRVLVRSWDYRQRRHARGVWFRLRRAFAGAAEAYAISREAAQELIAEGHRLEPVGGELELPGSSSSCPPCAWRGSLRRSRSP